MKWLYLNDILTHIEGELIQGKGNPLIKRVTTRSKNLKNNTLLLYVNRTKKINLNEQYDSIVIVTDQPEQVINCGENICIVKVKNIFNAYGGFIRYYRSLFNIPVIGITGTAGKTTTKEMVKCILEKDHVVSSTWKSENHPALNLYYLLRLNERTEAAVFEMCVIHPGDLKSSCNHFQPQIRVLLNIGVHHLTGCKTPEIYRKAKEEIFEGLDPVNSVLILNSDDEYIKKIDASKLKGKIIYFGFSKQADFRAANVSYRQNGMMFTLYYQDKKFKVYVPGYGEHNVYNALAAIAAASEAGVPIQEACNRLASFSPVIEHMQFRTGVNGCTVIDDTWNSSPPSMTAALQVLKDVAKSKRKIAILGYMPPLGSGEWAKKEYAKMGEKAVKTGVYLLIVVGNEAGEIGRKALELGMDKSKVFFCNTGTDVFRVIAPLLDAKTIILLKVTHRVMVRPSFAQLKKKIIL